MIAKIKRMSLKNSFYGIFTFCTLHHSSTTGGEIETRMRQKVRGDIISYNLQTDNPLGKGLGMLSSICLSLSYHPWLSEINTPIGYKEVTDTPTNPGC